MVDNLNQSLLLQSDYFTIQISSSEVNEKARADNSSIARNLSLIDFSECEHYLKSQDIIKRKDVLKYSKIDWKSQLKTSLMEENSTDSDSVSYNLYTSKGERINMNKCASTQTLVQIMIKNLNVN